MPPVNDTSPASTATSPVLALSVRQPWAWAIIHAGKDVENRSWDTRHRGVLWVHAGQRIDWDAFDTIRRITGYCPSPEELVTGALIGHVQLTGTGTTGSPWAEVGGLHWQLTDPVATRPVRCRGRLGLFDVREILSAPLTVGR